MTISQTQADHDLKLASHVAVIFLVGLLLMAMLLSSSLVSLSYDLPPGGFSESIVTASETWHGLMTDLGTDLPVQMIFETVESTHEIAINNEY